MPMKPCRPQAGSDPVRQPAQPWADLAARLMNAHDHHHKELEQVRGAIAQDLHGAFADDQRHRRPTPTRFRASQSQMRPRRRPRPNRMVSDGRSCHLTLFVAGIISSSRAAGVRPDPDRAGVGLGA
jgi:hypothetical protein